MAKNCAIAPLLEDLENAVKRKAACTLPIKKHFDSMIKQNQIGLELQLLLLLSILSLKSDCEIKITAVGYFEDFCRSTDFLLQLTKLLQTQ